MKQKSGFGFTIRFPRKYRENLAEVLFEWAERQKPVDHNKWFLFELQQHREMQKNIGESSFEITRSKDSSKIEFIGFRLFEVFHYEEFETLQLGLKNLFPDAEQIDGNNFFSNFNKIRDSITTGLWMSIGSLSKMPYKGFSGPRLFRQIPSLNEYIDFIEIGVQKISPSIFVLSFDVYLKNEISEKITSIQSKKFLADASLNSVTFGSFPRVNVLLSSSDVVRTKAIRDFISNIRISVEENIKPYVKGLYLSQTLNNHLPSIETYRLTRPKKKQKDFYSWMESNFMWWRSFGFILDREKYFVNKNIAFSYSFGSNDLSNATNSAFFFQEKFPEQPRHIWGKMTYFLNEITPLVAVSEILTVSRNEIENRRRTVFDLMKRENRFLKLIKPYQDMQSLGKVLQRLILELDQGLLFFGYNTFFDLSELNQIEHKPSHLENENLKATSVSAVIKKNIDYLGKLLTSQLEFINKEFSSHIEILNIHATYRLQVITLWLTVMATLLGVISLLSNYHGIIDFIKTLLDWFKKTF